MYLLIHVISLVREDWGDFLCPDIGVRLIFCRDI